MSEPRHEAAEEYWGQSLKRPRIVCESQIESEARVWAEGEVWEEGSVSPQKIFENSYTWNRASCCIVEAKNLSFSLVADPGIRWKWEGSHIDPIQIQLSVFGNGTILGIYPGFWSRWCWLNPGLRSSDLDPSLSQLGGLGEPCDCEFPSGVWGRAPAANDFGAF